MNLPQYDLSKAAQKIRRWQKMSGLKGKDIARMAGISAAYFSDISRGKQRGSIEVLARIAGVFDRKLDDLLESDQAGVAFSAGLGAPHLQTINTPELKSQLQPLLGEQTSDFVDCFQLWVRAPRALREALQVFHEAEDTVEVSSR